MTGRLVARLGLVASLLLGALIRLPLLRFVPIWDGRNYWDDCAQPALLGSFDPLAFNCFGHRSLLYMLTVSWPQYFDHGSTVLLNLANLVLSLVAIYAFYRIAITLFTPGDDPYSGLDAALLTLIFAAMPVWTASSINLNPDFGVLVGFLIALAMLLESRLAWATAAGIFMVLSKEIGLLLWVALAGIDTLLVFLDKQWRAVLKRWVFIVPPLAYFAIGAWLRSRALPETWSKAQPAPSLVRMFLRLDLTDRHYAAYITDLFILNFAWVMTAVIVTWLVAIVVFVFKHRPLPVTPVIDRRKAAFIALAALAVTYLLTRYPTFNNPRYLLAAFPLLIVVFGIAAATMIHAATTRATLLALTAVLQLASMWYTVDPVSMATFGTFDFGDHPMLNMTSLTGECCGYGRDQLVYNLQFTHFDDVQQKLFRTIRPKDGDPIATSYLAPWYLLGPLDPKTHERTLRNAGVIRPRYLTLRDFKSEADLPNRLTYIQFPNIDDRRELWLFSQSYDMRGPYIVDDDGYRIAVYDLRKR